MTWEHRPTSLGLHRLTPPCCLSVIPENSTCEAVTQAAAPATAALLATSKLQAALRVCSAGFIKHLLPQRGRCCDFYPGVLQAETWVFLENNAK